MDGNTTWSAYQIIAFPFIIIIIIIEPKCPSVIRIKEKKSKSDRLYDHGGGRKNDRQGFGWGTTRSRGSFPILPLDGPMHA